MRFIQNVNTYFAIFSDFFHKRKMRMSIKEKVKELCKVRSISLNKLEQEIGVASGYLSKLDNPGIKTIKLIADYFDVSVDYLIAEKEVEFITETAKKDVLLTEMSNKIKEYALKLAEMPKEQQEQIMSLIDMLSDKKEG